MSGRCKIVLERIISSHKLPLLMFLIFACNSVYSQYFSGPNKPSYKEFEYKVYTTPHFEIYHYFTNDSILQSLANITEKWYLRHQMIFKDTFKARNPIIFYSNHADFQQTNAIMGTIGAGTGGVTEALKNRIVLPVMESAAQTDHVIGHELVHAFQYRLILGEDSTLSRNIRNVPLWMIEGLAEYMSIGSTDSHTAMWIRDALINNDFPSLDDMSRSYKYFPYRYGQAFWAFTTALYSDTIILPLLEMTSRYGYEKALETLTIYNEKSFSAFWKSFTKEYYYQFIKDTIEKPVGNKIIHKKNSGTINIVPSISPDGKYVIFLSEKDLFTFDLFMANAQTGKIIKKISSTVRDNQIDDFNYLESGGCWSPDGSQFAFVTFSKGRNRIMVVKTKHTRKHTEFDLQGIEAFSNPAWSPDGSTIVVTGLNEGVTDLYTFNVNTKKVTNITNDIYSNTMPAWSPDGKYILFSTDKPLTNFDKTSYNIGILSIETGKIELLPLFPGAENLNPQFSPNGENVYFLSNADGFRNLYKYNLKSLTLYRLTNLNTGISGITQFSPAFSIDRKDGNIIYTHYSKNEYNLYQAPDSLFKAEQVDPFLINMDAGMLPPFKRLTYNIVNNNLDGIVKQQTLPVDSFKKEIYKPKFMLDYIGGSNMGVSTNSYYGTGMAGSIDMLWGDIVGNYQMYSSISVNGSVYDMAGSLAFINNKHTIDWGGSVSHIPYRYGEYKNDSAEIEGKMENILAIDKHWIFEDALTIFAVKPLSQTRRIEAFASMAYYSNRLEREQYVITNNGYEFLDIKRNLPTDNGFGITTIGTAYTLDNAYMGITSPLRGQRFRAEAKYYSGGLKFLNLLLDYRKYIYLNPLCIAGRLYHVGRYGNNTTNGLFRALYIGWPWLVRGYESSNPYIGENTYGSRIAVANIELRIPFTGPERLCIIPFKYFVSEISIFTDAGMAWNPNDKILWNLNPSSSEIQTTTKYPMVSYGASLRINLFGYMVIEPYYAFPLQKNGSKYAGIGFNFLPGW
jgi:Tol biopolymer transport system component